MCGRGSAGLRTAPHRRPPLPSVRRWAPAQQHVGSSGSETVAGAPAPRARLVPRAGAGSMGRRPMIRSERPSCSWRPGTARPPPPAGFNNGACAAAATSAGDTPRAANARGTARQPARPGHLVIQAISQVSHSMSGWVVRADQVGVSRAWLLSSRCTDAQERGPDGLIWQRPRLLLLWTVVREKNTGAAVDCNPWIMKMKHTRDDGQNKVWECFKSPQTPLLHW